MLYLWVYLGGGYENPVFNAGVVGFIGKVKNGTGPGLFITAGNNTDGNNLGGEADIPVGQHIKGMFNTRLSAKFSFGRRLVALAFQVFYNPSFHSRRCLFFCFTQLHYDVILLSLVFSDTLSIATLHHTFSPIEIQPLRIASTTAWALSFALSLRKIALT